METNGHMVPKLESRDFDEFFKELKALVPFYTPEWRINEDKNGAGLALVKIFLHMLSGIYQQLNRLPGKHLVEFLDRLGLKRFPAVPARVPVSFRLAEGAPGYVLVPAQTQVAAGDIIYETQGNFMATPAQLVRCFSIDRANDAIIASPANVIDGNTVSTFASWLLHGVNAGAEKIFLASTQGLEKGNQLVMGDRLSINQCEYVEVKDIHGAIVELSSKLTRQHAQYIEVHNVTCFIPFKGMNQQNHILYLGHPDLLKTGGKAFITLDFSTTDSQLTKELPGFIKKMSDWQHVEWEYFGQDNNNKKDWYALSASITRSAPLQVKLYKKMPGTIEELEVAGIKGRWLRCKVRASHISHLTGLKIDTVKAAIQPLQGSLLTDATFFADQLYYNDMAFDPKKISASTPFYPFGRTPVQYDTLYIASRELFSRKNSTITLALGFSAAGIAGSRGITLTWEYWNGKGWQILQHSGGASANFIQNGSVSFTCPADLSSTEINGHENYWIRVRLVDGDYGRVTYELINSTYTLSTSQVHPPTLELLTLSASKNFQPLTLCLTENNRQWDNHNEELEEAKKTFTPFYSLNHPADTLLLGFNSKLEKGPVSLFFALEEQRVAPENIPTLKWEYTKANNEWEKLEVIDYTLGLTRSGIVEINIPMDFKETIQLGEKYYWLRLQLLYPTDSNRPGLTISGIYLNTTWALQTETIKEEIAGSGDGSGQQQVTLKKIPVVEAKVWIDEKNTISDEEREQLKANKSYEVNEITDEKGDIRVVKVAWKEVADLLDSSATDRHYELDRVTGVITFGNGISGKVAPVGTDNIMVDYSCGGGEKGNCNMNEVTDLKTTLPFLDSTSNPLAASGGTNTETIERVLQRGPFLVKHQDRAISTGDFVQLAQAASPGIAQCICLPHVNTQGNHEPGWVTLVVIPASNETKPMVSLQLKQQLEEYLYQRMAIPLTASSHFQVWGPLYVEVDVRAKLVVTSMSALATAEKDAVSSLTNYLHPVWGGKNGHGWEFGKIPCFSDIYTLLESIPGVDYVADLSIILITPSGDQRFPAGSYTLDTAGSSDFRMPAYGIVCNGKHEVSVS